MDDRKQYETSLSSHPRFIVSIMRVLSIFLVIATFVASVMAHITAINSATGGTPFGNGDVPVTIVFALAGFTSV